MRKIFQVFDRLLFVGTASTSILFFAMILLSIISRFLLKRPILASIELSRFFFIWSCFLAAALAYHRKAHVGFTLLYEKFSPFIQKWMSNFIYAVIVAFCTLVLVHGIDVVLLLWYTKFPMLGISQAWLYIPVPIVCFFLIIFTLELWMESITRKEN
ncbi:TRAP transporter small permease [candidate division KSB1 bacterium]|nr:TRAP transporter small permease [candidate division KSB1 bacterium]